MSYKIAIRREADGEVRVATLAELTWKGDPDFWWLTEGNYGCDCNRELEFYRERQDGPTRPDLHACLGHGAYSILYAELPDGRRIPIDEFEDIP